MSTPMRPPAGPTDLHPDEAERIRYEEDLRRLGEIFDAEPGTTAGAEAEQLTLRVCAYEERYFHIPAPAPDEASRFRQEQLDGAAPSLAHLLRSLRTEIGDWVTPLYEGPGIDTALMAGDDVIRALCRNAKSEGEVDLKYPVMLYWIEDQGEEPCVYAYHPDFGHSACSATGKTVHEALGVLDSVRTALIAHYKETGMEIPKPTRIPGTQEISK